MGDVSSCWEIGPIAGPSCDGPIWPPRINHPRRLKRTLDYIGAVATHFKGHPALLAYNTFNEIGNESFDSYTIAEFIAFVRNQYSDDIRKLNHAWGCFFDTFERIAEQAPRWGRWRWTSPLAQRDWLRFRGQNFVDRMDDWAAAIREVDADVVIFADILGADTMHNRAGGRFGVNDWQVAEHVDVLGLSCYDNMLSKKWWEVDSWRWAQWWRSTHSAAGGKQTMISEMMTQNRTMFPGEASSMTDQIRLWSYQAIFHGVKGLIYWKYRPFRRGLHVAGRGLTDFNAEPNQFGKQAAEVAAFTARHADPLAGAVPDCAGCAILHDHNTQDIDTALQQRDPDFYTDAHAGIFRGFWSCGVSPLYVRTEDIRDGVPEWVKVLAIPCNIAVSQQTADALADFVRRGGRLFTEGRFALLNEDATLWNHVPGGGLADVFGVEECNFTARFCDTLPIGSHALTFENDYFQTLKLADDVKVHCRTITDTPAAAARKVGDGLYVHTPFLLGAKIHQQTPGALETFEAIMTLLRPALTPAVEVVAKNRLTDVSILLADDGAPLLAGITNYEDGPATVCLNWPHAPKAIEGDDSARAERSDGQLEIKVSARSAAAVFL